MKSKKPKKAELQGDLTSKLFRQFEKFLDEFVSEYSDVELDDIPLGRSMSGSIFILVELKLSFC